MRTKRSISIIVLMVFVLLMLTVSACGNSDSEGPDEEQPSEQEIALEDRLDFVWADRCDPVWLNPLLEKSGDDIRNNRLIFDRLFVFDEEAKPIPQIAKDVEVSEDGLSYTVMLNEDITWHDGEPLTSEDVVFTYEKALDPKVACRYASNLWALVGYDELNDEEDPKEFSELDEVPVVAVDEHTVEFKLTTPYAPFVSSSLTSPAIVPEHLLADAGDMTEAEFNQHPVGSGPFEFEKWERDDYLRLLAYDDYFQGPPAVSSITNRIIPDDAVGAMELQSGGIHYRPLAKLENYQQFESDQNFETLSEVGFSYSTLAFVNDREPWDDVRVRKAIAYGIDMQEAVEKYVGDLGMHLGTPIPPSSWAHHPDLEPRPHDPEEALRLLNEAGWEQDDEGVLRNEDGEKFTFAFETFRGVERADMNVIFQENLRQIGIEAECNERATADLLNKMHKAEHSDVIFITWGMSPDPDAEMFRRFHSSEMDWNNFYHYDNPEVDELLEKAREEQDQGKRKDMYFDIQEILYEDVPGVFAFTKKYCAAHTPALSGVRWGSDGWYDFAHLLVLEE